MFIRKCEARNAKSPRASICVGAICYDSPWAELGIMAFGGGLDGAMYRMVFRDYFDAGN